MIVIMQKEGNSNSLTLKEKLCKMKSKILELEEKIDEHIAEDLSKKTSKEEGM